MKLLLLPWALLLLVTAPSPGRWPAAGTPLLCPSAPLSVRLPAAAKPRADNPLGSASDHLSGHL